MPGTIKKESTDLVLLPTLAIVLGSADLDPPHLPSAPGPDPLELITAGIVSVVVVSRRNTETDARSTEAAALESATVTTTEMTAIAVTHIAMALTSTAVTLGKS